MKLNVVRPVPDGELTTGKKDLVHLSWSSSVFFIKQTGPNLSWYGIWSVSSWAQLCLSRAKTCKLSSQLYLHSKQLKCVGSAQCFLETQVRSRDFVLLLGCLYICTFLHNLKNVVFNAAFQPSSVVFLICFPILVAQPFSAGTQESNFRFTFYFALFCHCRLNNFLSLFSFVVCFVFVPKTSRCA